MLRKYNQTEADQKLNPQQQVQAFNAAMKARQQGTPQPGQAAPGAQAPGAPGAILPGTVNRQTDTTKKPGDKTAAKVKKAEPIQVKSFAAGMKAKGLNELAQQAEDLVRQGKFNAALDKYDTAQQVAPNNPMIKMGRAVAELGGSYYARAETHIREAFQQNPALMLAQYDLRNLLGEERLQTLVKDLRNLAGADKRDPRPVFLLSFIAYNTGSAQTADAYLDLADKRGGGRDPVLRSIRDHWTLPDKTPEVPQPEIAPVPTPSPAKAPQPNK